MIKLNYKYDINEFFSGKSQNSISLHQPLVIIILFAVVSLLPSMLYILIIMLQEYTSMFILNIVFFLFVYAIGIISYLLLWLVVSGLFFITTSIFHPYGSFKKTVELVGYGFMPLLVYQVIYSFMALSIISTIHLQSSSLTDVSTYFIQLKENVPLLPVLNIINIICIIGSAYIWILAIKHARKITSLNAILAVGIPVGTYIVYILHI